VAEEKNLSHGPRNVSSRGCRRIQKELRRAIKQLPSLFSVVQRKVLDSRNRALAETQQPLCQSYDFGLSPTMLVFLPVSSETIPREPLFFSFFLSLDQVGPPQKDGVCLVHFLYSGSILSASLQCVLKRQQVICLRDRHATRGFPNRSYGRTVSILIPVCTCLVFPHH